jgi:RNA polymerase sigma factor (sigma-70 family)
MDSTLLAFLRTTDAAERERLQDELILVQAAPAVRQTLGYRLRFHIGKGGANPANPDAEDLYHDVIAKLVKKLNDLRAQSENADIRDFRQYAVRVAVNACNDHLRSKYPARTRLKDKIRDTLERHRDFDLWKSEQGEMVCGFTAWRDVLKPCADYERVRSLEEQPEIILRDWSTQPGKHGRPAGVEWLNGRKKSLTNVVAGVFEWVGCPIELESLVNATAVILDVKEIQFESLEDENGPLPLSAHGDNSLLDKGHEEIFEATDTLQALWDEICRMPPNQRETMIFSFKDSRGDDLLSLLFDAGVASPSQIARTLNLPLDRLMEIWKEMPMPNAEIAETLGVERPQVAKWRHRAQKQLRKRFPEPK